MGTEANVVEAHIKDLINGSSVTRAISTGQFSVVEIDVDAQQLFAMSASKPFPVWVAPGPKFEPVDSSSNLAGDYVYVGETYIISVAIMGKPQEMREFARETRQYDRMIRRCIGYPTNWNSVSCFSKVYIQPPSPVTPVALIDEEGNELDTFYQLNILADITYRENHANES
jgi:hypothetical protein